MHQHLKSQQNLRIWLQFMVSLYSSHAFSIIWLFLGVKSVPPGLTCLQVKSNCLQQVVKHSWIFQRGLHDRNYLLISCRKKPQTKQQQQHKPQFRDAHGQQCHSVLLRQGPVADTPPLLTLNRAVTAESFLVLLKVPLGSHLAATSIVFAHSN